MNGIRLHGIRTTTFGKTFYTFLYCFYIMLMIIFQWIMYLLFYIVHVTSYSFTAVFAGVFGTIQTSAIDCICERS